jgi:ketosteroid isomerase-like protein
MATKAGRTAQEVSRHHARAVNAGDVEDIVSDCSDDAVFTTRARMLRGKDGLREAFTAVFEDLPDPRWGVHARILEGDVPFLEWRRAQAATSQAPDGAGTFLVCDGEIVLPTARDSVQPA